MRGAATGPIGALLVIVPLLSIPVLAVFGVPTFGPLTSRRRDASAEFSADLADEPTMTSRSTRDRRRKAKPEASEEEWDFDADSSAEAATDVDLGTASSADDDQRESSIRVNEKRTKSAEKQPSKPMASKGRKSKPKPPHAALDGWEADGGSGDDTGSTEDATDRERSDDEFDGALAVNATNPDDDFDSLDEDGFNPRLLTEAYAAAHSKKNAANTQPSLKSKRIGMAAGKKSRPQVRTAELDAEDEAEFDAAVSKSVPRSSRSSSPSNSATSPPKSLSEATRRLTRLGIGAEDFKLSGDQTEGFTFQCVLREGGRITKRFTAQAEDDVDAVADVLEQIEQYLATIDDRE